MANIYTIRMWSAHNLGLGTISGPTVPAGFSWIVRYVSFCYAQATEFMGVKAAFLVDPGSNEICGTPNASIALQVYGFDVHGAFVAGEQLRAVTRVAGWDLHVTGYQLTAP